ncbi:TetR-like C-terminal domain-containing protein [Microbacterium sp. NPDC076911]|uniref:TetR-like C-terminal domain-containing protein n=1 Tax=Microbacterium sp. NPDC076911 TaxID=3154958 RepID=UPI003443378D
MRRQACARLEHNLAAIAESLGLRAPSLYKHVDGMPGIRRGVMIHAKSRLAQALGHAAIGRSRDDAVKRMALAYRDWARAHPGQYSLTMRAAQADDDEDLEASTAIADVIYNVLSGYDLHGDDAVHATRFLRSALHGFIALETTGGFELAVDVDQSYSLLTDSVVTALASWSAT